VKQFIKFCSNDLFNELGEWELLMVRENRTKNIRVKRYGKGKKENVRKDF
jgi:hypothetical protein